MLLIFAMLQDKYISTIREVIDVTNVSSLEILNQCFLKSIKTAFIWKMERLMKALKMVLLGRIQSHVI